MVTASLSSITEINAKPSANDLADLRFLCPSWKYRKRYRPTMKFGVTSDFILIVDFSGFDRLKHPLFPLKTQIRGFANKPRFLKIGGFSE